MAHIALWWHRIKDNTHWSLLILALTTFPALAGSPAGRVMFVHGDAVLQRDGEEMPVERGDELHAGDTIDTATASSVQIRYDDGGSMAIKPNSTFTLERHRYDAEAPQNSQQSTELLRGGLRVITGAIGQAAPDNVNHSTPVATMGIRGTSFQILHIPEEGYAPLPDAEQGSYLMVESGLVAIITEAGTRLARPGEVFFAESIDQLPEQRPGALPLFGGWETPVLEPSDDTSGSFFQRATLLAVGARDELPTTVIETLTEQGFDIPENDIPDPDPDPDPEPEPDPDPDPDPDPEPEPDPDPDPDPEPEPDPDPEPEPDPDPEPEPDPDPEPEPDPDPEPEPWLGHDPEDGHTLLTADDVTSTFVDLYEQDVEPQGLGTFAIAEGEVTWGYWEAGTEIPDSDFGPLDQSLAFISASPELLVSDILPVDPPAMGTAFVFAWLDGTPLIDIDGEHESIDIVDGTITLEALDIGFVEYQIGIFLELDGGHGTLFIEMGMEETSEEFGMGWSIPLEGEGTFDSGSFTGHYIGDDAEAIMSLIEAYGEDGTFTGTGLFERLDDIILEPPT